MRKYEIMYILKADLDEAARTAEMEKLAKILTDNGGEIAKTDTSLGLRDLAYPIKDETKGYYVVLKVSMGNQAIDEFNRLVLINPSVLRHLIVVDHE
ncbi:MAG: 30S ribosomal protein S6 [Bacilli bacterium]|nr:30S ribosomal protein S6 [Bacilli bacterium]